MIFVLFLTLVAREPHQAGLTLSVVISHINIRKRDILAGCGKQTKSLESREVTLIVCNGIHLKRCDKPGLFVDFARITLCHQIFLHQIDG